MKPGRTALRGKTKYDGRLAASCACDRRLLPRCRRGASRRRRTGGASGPDAATEAPAARTSPSRPIRCAGATWYGPGLYGNKTACGQTLRPITIGVAHKTFPAAPWSSSSTTGTPCHPGDRPRPLLGGRAWDLTDGSREALDFETSASACCATRSPIRAPASAGTASPPEPAAPRLIFRP